MEQRLSTYLQDRLAGFGGMVCVPLLWHSGNIRTTTTRVIAHFQADTTITSIQFSRRLRRRILAELAGRRHAQHFRRHAT
jgi:hypothetical protein